MDNKTKEILINIIYLMACIILFTVLLFIIFLLEDKYFIRFLDLIKIIIWPIILLFSCLFFRKVFTYLFFSLEGFNFFRLNGTLKNIRELIDEKVEEKIKIKEEENKKNILLNEYAEKAKTQDKDYQNLFNSFEKLNNDYSELMQKYIEKADYSKLTNEELEALIQSILGKEKKKK